MPTNTKWFKDQQSACCVAVTQNKKGAFSLSANPTARRNPEALRKLSVPVCNAAHCVKRWGWRFSSHRRLECSSLAFRNTLWDALSWKVQKYKNAMNTREHSLALSWEMKWGCFVLFGVNITAACYLKKNYFRMKLFNSESHKHKEEKSSSWLTCSFPVYYALLWSPHWKYTWEIIKCNK